MIGLEGESLFGFVLVIILILSVFIGFIWLELIEKPKEKRENESQLKELQKNPSFLDSGKILISKIEFLRHRVLPCKKCKLVLFTIWDIQPNLITIRCNQCKKKIDLKDSDIEEGFIQKLIHWHNKFLELLYLSNPLLEEYKKTPFDFSSLRKNQPVFQPYSFQAECIKIEAKEEKEEFNMGNRRISRDVQNRVWRRDGGKCINCGSNEKLEFDHIIPFSKGGSNTYRNIQLLCESCNREKSNRIG